MSTGSEHTHLACWVARSKVILISGFPGFQANRNPIFPWVYLINLLNSRMIILTALFIMVMRFTSSKYQWAAADVRATVGSRSGFICRVRGNMQVK